MTEVSIQKPLQILFFLSAESCCSFSYKVCKRWIPLKIAEDNYLRKLLLLLLDTLQAWSGISWAGSVCTVSYDDQHSFR